MNTTAARTIGMASAGALCAASAMLIAGQKPASAATKTVSIRISGGHKTLPADNGRPVVLVAGALGVKPSVFRKAFSGVHPADQGSGPTSAEAQANKQALLKVLGPYGVTNDQIDAASNKYRYNGSAGEMWPTTAAKGAATIKNGRVVSIQITRAGSGYTSKPSITVPGYSAKLAVKLHYGKKYATNGSIKSVTVK